MNFLARRKENRRAAERAYRRVVEQARQPAFFTDLAVPDTLDGRFELICVHAFLFLHRLKSEGRAADRMGQGFFDVMFADLDRSLRETGVGDLSVGKHVKRMAQGFYGRMRAYQEGLAGDDATLTAAIERNVFGTTAGPAPMATILGAYMRAAAAALQHQSIGHLLAGEFCFASLQACERAGPAVKADAS